MAFSAPKAGNATAVIEPDATPTVAAALEQDSTPSAPVQVKRKTRNCPIIKKCPSTRKKSKVAVNYFDFALTPHHLEMMGQSLVNPNGTTLRVVVPDYVTVDKLGDYIKKCVSQGKLKSDVAVDTESTGKIAPIRPSPNSPKK